MSDALPAPPATLRLVFPKTSYSPIAALALAQLSGTALDVQPDPKLASGAPPVINISKHEQLTGHSAVLRFLARAAPDKSFAGASIVASVEVDHWIDCTSDLVPGSDLEAACSVLDKYLALRTFLAGHQLSAADIACWAKLAETAQWDGLRKSKRLPHVSRWYDFLSSIPQLKALAEQYHPRRKAPAPKPSKSAAASTSTKMASSDASFDIGLGPEWQGKVVTRFPPEPSGFLHVGHAKALILNQQIATANNGRMLIRFDDTNPDKEKDVFVDSILEDVKKLGVTTNKVTFTSNYFDQMLDLAERLIEAGHLYADDTPQEKMKEERLAKQPSQRRERSKAENLRIWKEMVAGSEEGFCNCLRFKMDPVNNNGALRDPVAYRCNATPHLHTGTKYKVYPTYDCACPFVDALEGVTHALRTSEYRDREEQFYRILKMQQQVWPGLPDVAVWDYSRLSFVHTVLSKRKLTKLVNMGAVDGWDDPRMPTVQGLLRRGLTVPALREFILAQGASRNVTFQEWDKIWSFNKKVIDPVCPRHTAVKVTGKVPLKLTNVEGSDFVTVSRHAKNPDAGQKVTQRSPDIWIDQEDAMLLKENEEVTLMEWGNAIIKVIRKDEAGNVSSMEGVTHLEGKVSGTKWKLTWLADAPDLIPLSLVDFDHLISKKKLEDDDEIEDLVTLCSRWETEASGDTNMRTLQKGDIIQLMRRGYFIVDLPFVRPGKPMVLLSIPDGKSKTPVKPETAVKQAQAARDAAKAASLAAAKNAASAAALKSKAKPVSAPKVAPAAFDSNGLSTSSNSAAREEARPRDVAAEAEEAPVSSKVAAPTSSVGILASPQDRSSAAGIHARPTPTAASASLREASATSPPEPPATSLPIPVPARTSPEERSGGSVPPTPANTPQTSTPLQPLRNPNLGIGMRQPAGLHPGAGMPVDGSERSGSDVPMTPHNTPASSTELPSKLSGGLLLGQSSRLGGSVKPPPKQ